jgi:hypothetical protein
MWDAQSWASGANTGSSTILDQIDCPSANRCFAAGTTGVSVVSGTGVWIFSGRSWQRSPWESGDSGFGGPVSYLSASHCVALLAKSEILSNSHWTRGPGVPALTARSCPTTKLCMGAGTEGSKGHHYPSVTVFNGKHWSESPTGSQSGQLEGIS